MKRFFAAIVILMMGLPCFSLTLEGGVVYTVESARKAAFEGIEYEISMEPYQKYMTDPGFIAPGEGGKKPKVSKKGRWVTYFDDGSYGISYYGENRNWFHYNNLGHLDFIEIRNNYHDYPNLGKQYDIAGRLTAVIYKVNPDEQFIYKPDKTLSSHWKKNTCYDENGKIIHKRY